MWTIGKIEQSKLPLLCIGRQSQQCPHPKLWW